MSSLKRLAKELLAQEHFMQTEFLFDSRNSVMQQTLAQHLQQLIPIQLAASARVKRSARLKSLQPVFEGNT